MDTGSRFASGGCAPCAAASGGQTRATPERRRRRRGACLVLLLAAAGACGGESGDAAPPVAEHAARPATLTAELPFDGRTRTVPLRLYQPPDGFPVGFSTYLPSDVRAERSAEGDGDVVSFVWGPGGAGRESSFLQLFVYAPDITESAAREVVRTAAERFRIPGDRSELQPVDGPAWATVTYRIVATGTTRPPLTGSVMLGRRDGRWFHLLVQHPAAATAWVPRAAEILSRWRWADGTALDLEP